MRHKTTYWLFLALLLLSSMGSVKANNYGLRLKSHDFEGRERTGLLLLDGEPIPLGDLLTVRFQLDMRSAPVFGNMLTIRGNDEQMLEFRITLDDNMKTYSPSLRTNDDIYPIDYTLRTYSPLQNLTAAVTLDRAKNRVTTEFGGKSRSIDCDLRSMTEAVFNFGRQMFHLGSLDVAPIDLWDVEVVRDGQPLYFWELRAHRDSITYDRLQQAPATASSALWLLDSHTIWQPAFNWTTQKELQYTFSHATDQLYVIDDDSLVVWNMATGQTTTHAIRGGYRAMRWSKYLYVNDRDHTLYSYNLARGMVTRLDTTTWTWQNPDYIKDEPAYLNHAQMSIGGDTAYAFGGYGFYRYNNKLFRIVTGSNAQVEVMDYKPLIAPRTHMAGTQVGQKLYLFGGMGNEQGKQELPQVDYADLWEIDLPTMKARKLWETQSEKRLVLTSQMVYDDTEKCFYAATSMKKTARIYLNEPKIEWVGDTIPMILDYTLLNYGLFKSEHLQRMLLVVDRRMSNAEHFLETYTIELPILSAEHLDQQPDGKAAGWLWWLLGGAALILIGVSGWRWRVAQLRRSANATLQPAHHEPTAAAPATSPLASPSPESEPETPRFYDNGKAEIRMLGEFMVFDKAGQDITSKFTRRSRDLLMMLLLNGVSKNKGVEIRRLDEELWPEMKDDAARNNRNVYMRKLRVLLEEVGSIDITNDKINYKTAIGRDVLFDYKEACRLMSHMEQGETDDELTARTLELLLRGPLLPGMSVEWLDDLKSDYSNRALSLLHRLAQQALAKGNDTLAYRIADAIMAHDPFSEEALAMQCQILCRRKTMGIAKNIYDKFCKTYEQALGEPYARSFAEVCKEN